MSTTAVEKVNPLLYITNWTPTDEATMDATGWFEWEYASVHVTEDDQAMLGWYLAQGWVVYNTLTERIVGRVGDRNEIIGYVYSLKRYKIQSNRVMQDMIDEFTSAYNEGRTLNDRRYDEIVALNDVMLSRSEAEFNALDTELAKYDTIVDTVIAGLPTSYTEYKADVTALLDAFGVSHRERINTQFDNELAVRRQDLVNRGMYNSTVWDSVSSGVAQNRAKALNDLEDKIIERRLASMDRIQSVRMDVSNRLESASNRLAELKASRRFTASDFRNKILTAMLAFMERRSDDYPGMEALAELAAKLGYSEGGAVAAST